MPDLDDNVVQMPLVRLAAQIKTALAGQKNGRTTWKVASFDLCLALAEARQQFTANQEFGEWFDRTIGDEMNHQTRAAAIAMGREPEALRKALDATERTSLEQIHLNDFSRFTDVRKTPRKKRTTPETPQTDAAYEAILERKRQDKPIPGKKEFAKEIGISHMAVEKAWDRYHQEQAKEPEADDQILGNLSEKGRIKLDDAIRIHKARLDKSFEQLVNMEVRRRIATADDHARRQLKEADRRLLEFERERGKRGVFSKAEFRQLQMVCHPDNSASPEMRARMLDLITKNQNRLVNPDKA